MLLGTKKALSLVADVLKNTRHMISHLPPTKRLNNYVFQFLQPPCANGLA
jgi:hypothetical protein